MWVFGGREFQHGVNLNPAMVSDPNWRVRAVGDFDHDGHRDLVWQYAPTGQVAVWFMAGSNLVRTMVLQFPLPREPTGKSSELATRIPTAMWIYWQHRPTGMLVVWRLVYFGPFVSLQELAFSSGLSLSDSPSDPGWRAVGLSDLDLDGSPEIIFQHVPSGIVAAWYLDGSTVRSGIYLSPSSVGTSNWKLVGPR
jgi:hypothetical protein